MHHCTATLPSMQHQGELHTDGVVGYLRMQGFRTFGPDATGNLIFPFTLQQLTVLRSARHVSDTGGGGSSPFDV